MERELNLGPLDITSERDNDVFAALEKVGWTSIWSSTRTTTWFSR